MEKLRHRESQVKAGWNVAKLRYKFKVSSSRIVILLKTLLLVAVGIFEELARVHLMNRSEDLGFLVCKHMKLKMGLIVRASTSSINNEAILKINKCGI